MKGANMNLPTGVFDPFRNMTVGFDNIFDQLSTLSHYETPNYPPYNIKKIDKENYQLEMALAGFSKEDIDVEVKESILTISAKTSEKDDDNFVHRGIAQRAFKRQWTLAEHLEVDNATFKDGVLIVDMKLNLPEEKKPKTIKIK
jgi:molecular chaperone IbpA|tara:strand:- start:1930 stop:2361 length:432 start_codon:yes stop_codon:yes gene_type:complete